MPAVNPNTNLQILLLLGKILVHRFIVCDFLPVRLAFLVIAAILHGPNVVLSDDVYLESLLDYISTHDISSIREALREKAFTSSLTVILLAILSRLGCTQVPTPLNIRQLLIDAAKHQFKIKPLGALYSVYSGVPVQYQPFWRQFSTEKLFDLYKALNATPRAVLEMINEPECLNLAESRVYNYLWSFIANMRQVELRQFLCFIILVVL